MKCLFFSLLLAILWVIFAIPDPDSDIATQINPVQICRFKCVPSKTWRSNLWFFHQQKIGILRYLDLKATYLRKSGIKTNRFFLFFLEFMEILFCEISSPNGLEQDGLVGLVHCPRVQAHDALWITFIVGVWYLLRIWNYLSVDIQQTPQKVRKWVNWKPVKHDRNCYPTITQLLKSLYRSRLIS
jgi:hypothetical protein